MSASATASPEGNLPYAHLHVHTEYSMLDGAARLKDLFKCCTFVRCTTTHNTVFE